MKKRVLVIGATGFIGQAIAKQLKKDGFTVRVLTRDLEKANEIFNEDYEKIQGNVLQPETLSDALDNVNYVYINLPEKDAPEGVKNLVDKLRNTDIKRIGYTSGCTVRKENAWHPMINSHYQADETIINSGLPYSIFRPTMVLDMIPRYANNGKAFIIGKQNNGWSWIYSEDMAKMISNAFQTEKAKNKKFTIFGPEKCSIPEAVDSFNKIFFPDAKKASPRPYWMANILAIFIGSSLKYAISLFKYFDSHPEEGNPQEAVELLGKPETDLNSFFEIYKNQLAQNNK
jgi:uncharacterized protein YbjT (DUF2867 family)